MRFEWDSRKNRVNLAKRGVSFQEAREVFGDPLRLSILDERLGYVEERWLTISRTEGGRCADGEEVIRVASTRDAAA